MIPCAAPLTTAYVPLDCILYPTSAHWPDTLDIDRVHHYVGLLERHLDRDTDPILLTPVGPHYTITNGRHRFIAHCIAGRATIAAVIVHPT